MEENEILKAEIEKLNGRLQKAIQVFAEQKATITRVTTERDGALAEIQNLRARVSELESKEAASSENDSKFFEQIKEIDELNTKLKDINVEYNSLKDKSENDALIINQLNEANIKLNKDLETAKNKQAELVSEYDTATAKLNNELVDLKNTVTTYETAIAEDAKMIQDITAKSNEYEKMLEKTKTARSASEEKLDAIKKILGINNEIVKTRATDALQSNINMSM